MPPSQPTPRPAGPLRLGRWELADGAFAVMGIVNRTPDSFYDRGRTFALDAALHAGELAVASGAEIIDVGGVKAGPGAEVGVAEEIDRVGELVASLRARHPQVAISVDTWRAEVAEVAVAAGADLINDTWGGVDVRLAEVAARTGAGLVCAHAGGLDPRTRPHRVRYDDVVADIIATTTALAERAVAAGVRPDGILVDAAHDFGKNTRHSLEVVRRTDELVATGWPVLASLSRKDFVGETLDLPPEARLHGTLAATALSAWLGARVFRAHDVAATRQVLDMVASVQGTRPPAVARRGLA